MSEIIKLKIEGDTYVIPGEEPYNEAKVKHPRDGNCDWNDFQAMGENNIEEGEYELSADADPERVAGALERARDMRFRFGRGVLNALSQVA